jgi:hypothetical protein
MYGLGIAGTKLVLNNIVAFNNNNYGMNISSSSGYLNNIYLYNNTTKNFSSTSSTLKFYGDIKSFPLNTVLDFSQFTTGSDAFMGRSNGMVDNTAETMGCDRVAEP